MVQPTPKQLKIRDAATASLLVVAPAGCGKTEALALRVAGMLERGSVEAPQRVLVTTFSNRATDNIRQRLRDHCSAAALRERVTVTNFHGLAARIFQAHATTIGVDPSLLLPDSDWVGDQFQSRNTPWPQREAVSTLLRQLKQDAATDEQIAQALAANGNALATELEALRVQEARLTYDDLLRLAELILQNPAVRSLYQQHFGAVVVDEFQDLTPQQLRVINHIGHQRTTFAGDLAQGIYAFAGAQPDHIDQMVRAECSQVIELSESHRSSPSVLKVVNALAGRTGGESLTSADPSSWPGGGLATSIAFDDAFAEADWIVRASKYILSNAPGHRIGVLANIGSRRRFADNAFQASGLDVHRWDDGVFDTEAAKVLRKALSSFSMAEFVNTPDQLEYLRLVTGFNETQDPSTREGLVSAIGWACDLLQSGEDPHTVRSRIRVGEADTLLTATGVHLLSAHVGKGQQFDWVFVLGLEEGSMPFFKAETAEALAEQARVLAVMVSRARHGVFLTRSRSVETLAGNPQAKVASTFLQDITDADAVATPKVAGEWLKTVDWHEVARR